MKQTGQLGVREQFDIRGSGLGAVQGASALVRQQGDRSRAAAVNAEEDFSRR